VTDLHWLGARAQARLIAAKELSPVEIVRAHLERIARLDGRLHSFLAIFADQALSAAQAAEQSAQSGHPLGPLHGVPVAVKDLYDVAGTPTTAGARIPIEPAVRDCTAVARLRSAGAILLGKLNLHEFAYGPTGINPHHGTPWNPWDATTQRIPGGSSSGSGVAVAAGLVPIGLGSDTGGSIRIPAACCGTVGLKPTYGRISKAGVFPLSWSLDHAGPLTRTVEDAALALAVLAGHDAADPTSSRQPVADYLAALATPVRGLRLGLLGEFMEQVEPEVQAAVVAAAAVFRSLGCTVEEMTLPLARYAPSVSFAIQSAEAWAHHEALLRRHAADYGVDVRRRLIVGAFISAGDYVKAQKARRLIRDEVAVALRRVDALLLPALPVAAPAITETEARLPGGAEPLRRALTRCTRLANVTGHPAICLPCGFTRTGLPLSLQIVGRVFDEATILRLAHAYEMTTDWGKRRPPASS
jgi:aspartyl-tRNA(Asn)/glutamyl-tRNA(Gln) amidotransferase subunit A